MAKRKQAEPKNHEPKRLDPYSEEYKKATLDMLVFDAVARNDKAALEWLKAESGKKETRTRNGVNVSVTQNIAKTRANYAKKFLDFKPTKQSSAAQRKKKQEEAERARLQLFEEAFSMLKDE